MTQPTRKRRGSGRVKLREVAELAGVSPMTVSRYFSQRDLVAQEAQMRIAAAIEQTGYVANVFAGGLASARGKSVGMVIPNISGGVFAETVQGVTDTLRPHGYQLLLASSNYSGDEEEEAVRAFIGWSPAALILTGHRHTRGTNQLLAKSGIPVVQTWDHKPSSEHIQVGFSHIDVGKDSTRYLYERGYRRIAFVHTGQLEDFRAIERANGYDIAMSELGLTPTTFKSPPLAPLEAGKLAFQSLLRGRWPAEAIIFANDNLAAGALLYCLREKIEIPRECAVMGFGDLSIADKLVPSLTTIRPPRYDIGCVAAQRVLELLRAEDGEIPADTVQRDNVLPYELIEREST
ncbi:LacI family DNA-binding transcriptional regulator [Cupriavidus sp. TMH.W2]|uniref:LacI family DNA-binding transcriptional regulator n=1 Tax=Cupriavidus sp. TMH.W2 TaxID=3434465 RepID=UPI003D77C66A